MCELSLTLTDEGLIAAGAGGQPLGDPFDPHVPREVESFLRFVKSAEPDDFDEVRRSVLAEVRNLTRKPEVRTPGAYAEARVDNSEFARMVLPHLPAGETVFRHGSDLKRIVGGSGTRSLQVIEPHAMRVLVDQHVHLMRARFDRKEDKEIEVFAPCSLDRAGLLLAALRADDRVPVVESFSRYPVWTRTTEGEWRNARPGYDPHTRHYLDLPPDLNGFELSRIDPDKAHDRDLVHRRLAPDHPGPFRDFPWSSEADAENALAALLTLLMRPGLRCPVPMFLVTAPLERTGKTLLCDALVRIATGEGSRPRSLADEIELRKEVSAVARAGEPVLLLDNIPKGQLVNSAELASLLTRTEITFRNFRTLDNLTFPNRLTVMATGNVTKMSREIAFRTIPIELVPANDHPEARDLPNLEHLIHTGRGDLLAVLHGMVAAWVHAGCPPGPKLPVGGFEGWRDTVGGVMALWGFDAFGGNLARWREEADAETDDTDRFLLAWEEKRRPDPTKKWQVSDLLKIVEEERLFPEILGVDQRAKLTQFSRQVLPPLTQVPRTIVDENGEVRMFTVVRHGTKATKRYRYTLDITTKETPCPTTTT